MSLSHILLVEDDSRIRDAYAKFLEADGYRVSRAGTCAEAQEIALSDTPALIILDVMLPDGNGMELCGEFKANAEFASTFIVMVSGERQTPSDQAAGIDAGADGFLLKPVERTAFLAQVRAFLRIREGEQRLRASEAKYRELAEDLDRQATELREANARLEEYGRLKAEFVANMSHELRTPLNAIIGFAQLMQMGMGTNVPLPGPYSDAVERILRNSRHLLALIDGVLDLSKIEAGRQVIVAEPVDVARCVEAAFGELQSLASQKHLDFRLTILDDLPLALTDPMRLRQVAINLISNAIKFTTEGLVSVTVSRWGGEHWRLTVKDTGMGIREEDFGLIFERFRQVDGSSTRAAGGAGLGLTIVHELVDQLGGWVQVSSVPGAGATFVVTLPLRRDGKVAVGEQFVVENVAASNGDKPLVLVIEDDADSASLLTTALEGAGYAVRHARDGSEGIRLANELHPTAITLDIMMPSVDGWDVLRSLRGDQRTAGIPVVVCSIIDDRPLGYRLGAAEYLLKPVDPARLINALEQVGASHGDQEEYVLVIDDERALRDVVSAALKEAGYASRTASSGEAALRIAAERPPIAVLVDLVMPGGMSGFEVVARLRTAPATEHVPILVITGKDITPEDRRLMSGEIADIVRKGQLSIPELSRRIRDSLGELGIKQLPKQDETAGPN